MNYGLRKTTSLLFMILSLKLLVGLNVETAYQARDRFIKTKEIAKECHMS